MNTSSSNPDIKQVRNRMFSAGEITRDTYFAAAAFNKYSARFIMGLKNTGVLDKITHITYHTYGAEAPYSCSYYGVKRIRGFEEAFPEIKGKRTWWTEMNTENSFYTSAKVMTDVYTYRVAYEDTQLGPENGGPEVYEKMQAKCDDLVVEIGPNTLQAVTVVMRNAPKAK